MQKPELDSIDRGMLQSIVEHPGQAAIDIFRPFLRERSETVLRQRLRRLEIFEYIRSEHGMNKLCYFPKKRQL